MTPRTRRAARILAVLSLAACHRATLPSPPPPAPPPLDESEPNDDAGQAPWFGTLAPGADLAIAGHVASTGHDLFDGFAFTTSAPCTVRFTLTPALDAADLDLCVYDPFLDEFVACFDSPSGTEVGEIGFAVPGVDFHLVVTSAWAASSYLLEIEAVPFLAATAETPPASGAQGKDTLERLEPYRAARESSAAADAQDAILVVPLATGGPWTIGLPLPVGLLEAALR